MFKWMSSLFGRSRLDRTTSESGAASVVGLAVAEPHEGSMANLVEDAVPENKISDWLVFGQTVLGYSHLREGLPNQDSIGWRIVEPDGISLVLAVSDGHGSAKCFRSAAGSRFAVQIAIETICNQLFDNPGCELSMVKRALEDQVPQELERCWKQLVLQDIESNPLLAREVAHVEADQGLRARKQVEENPILAYGATLLIVVVHPQYLACIQLGDGDIVSVDDDGVAVRPVEEDGRLLANETTSLACEQAWRDFRVTFQSLCGRPPALLLASTDGYSNSFRSAEDFLKVGPDLLELIADEGIEAVQQKLPDWLADASRNGSGDDVSLGIILRRDVIHSLQEDVERLLDSPKPDRRGDESPSSIPSNTPSS